MLQELFLTLGANERMQSQLKDKPEIKGVFESITAELAVEMPRLT